MAAQSNEWSKLRQQARAQETQTESLFHTYAQFSSRADVDPKPSEEERRVEAQLNDILETRRSLLSSLSRLLDSTPTPPSALKSTNLARHREILSQHTAELSRLRASLAQVRDRANLLSNVRSDIASHNSRPSHSQPGQEEAEYHLNERSRLDNSHHMTDSVLAQAYAVREEFGLQGQALQGIQRRIVGAASRVPGINGLMGRIGSKKRRDGVILGSFIAVCFLVLLWFL